MNRLKQARRDAGYTQVEVAAKIGLSQPQYSAWENGRSKVDNVSLAKLAELFDVSVDYLLGLTDEKDGPLAEVDEEALDAELISRLKSLRPEDLAKVDTFVQWISEVRGESTSPHDGGHK